MRNISVYLGFFIIGFFALTSCVDEIEKPLIVTTSDYTITVLDNVQVGDTIGIVPGTSNQGSVAFRVISESPQGAVNIDNSYGEITVANASLFDPMVNPQMVIEVNVGKATTIERSTVTINVESFMECIDVNLFPLTGPLVMEEVGFDPLSGTGVDNGCGSYTLIGDLANFSCTNVPEVQFFFSEAVAGIGTLEVPRQGYNCDDGVNNEIEGFGTFDLNVPSMQVNYTLYQDGAELFGGVIDITIPDCTSPVNTDIWEGPISIEDVGFNTASAQAVAGCGEIVVVGGDFVSFGCAANDIVISLLPNGQAEIAYQSYICDDNIQYFISASGTHDETPEIVMTYEFFDENGDLVFPGDLVIVPE